MIHAARSGRSRTEYQPALPTYFLGSRPPGLHTRNQWLRLGYRVTGRPAARALCLVAKPKFRRRGGADPLAPDELNELSAALRRQPLHRLGQEHRLLLRADAAGQLLRPHLYAGDAVEEVVTPTEAEARQLVEWLLTAGQSRDEWLVEIDSNLEPPLEAVGPQDPPLPPRHKRLLTVGTVIPGRFDFRKHLTGRQPHGIKAGPSSAVVAIDIDRHSGSTPAGQHLGRLRELYLFLRDQRLPFSVHVNPRNGSTQVWAYVPGWSPEAIRSWARRLRQALPWVREVFPDNLRQVILPFRPDKTSLCDAECPKVRCRCFRHDRLTGRRKGETRTACSMAYVWQWLRRARQDPTQVAPWELVEEVVRKACSRLPDTTPAEPGQQASRHARRHASGGQGPGRLTFKGRYLALLQQYYALGRTPPENTITQLEQAVIRHCRWGRGLSESHTWEVLHRLRRRLEPSFSDRLNGGAEAELDRVGAYVVGDPGRYLPAPELSRRKWQAVEAYCRRGGLDITDPDTFARRPAAGARSRLAPGGKVTEVVEGTAAVCGVDTGTALQFLEVVTSHVERKAEMAYSLVKGFLAQVGVAGTNNRVRDLFRLWRGAGFLVLQRNYFIDHSTGMRLGNFYVLGPEFSLTQAAPAGQGATTAPTPPEEEGRRSTYPISLRPPLHRGSLLLEARRLRCDALRRARLWAVQGRPRSLAA